MKAEKIIKFIQKCELRILQAKRQKALNKKHKSSLMVVERNDKLSKFPKIKMYKIYLVSQSTAEPARL